MPAFAALVASLFSALSLFLAKLFAAKLAIRIAAVVAITSLGTGLMTTFNNVISPLVAQAFSSEYGQFLGLAFPPIAGTCLAAILATFVAIQTYQLQVRAINLTANM